MWPEHFNLHVGASSAAYGERSQLPAEPIVTVARAAEVAGVSNTAADNAVRALEAAGVLKQVGTRNWGRLWEAPDVFRLLDESEHELATPEGASRPARLAPRRARSS